MNNHIICPTLILTDISLLYNMFKQMKLYWPMYELIYICKIYLLLPRNNAHNNSFFFKVYLVICTLLGQEGLPNYAWEYCGIDPCLNINVKLFCFCNFHSSSKKQWEWLYIWPHLRWTHALFSLHVIQRTPHQKGKNGMHFHLSNYF